MNIDGAILVCLSLFIFSQGYFTSDEAFKYVNPYILFWMKYLFGLFAAGLSGLKAFRSTSYADGLKKKNKKNASKV